MLIIFEWLLENNDKCVISMDLVATAQLGLPFVISNVATRSKEMTYLSFLFYQTNFIDYFKTFTLQFTPYLLMAYCNLCIPFHK